MSLPDRDDIPRQYRFDLSAVYETPSDWRDDGDAFERAVADLDALAADPIERPEDLRDLLALTEAVHERKQSLELYATLSRNVATDDEAARERLRRFRDLESEFRAAVDAVRRRLADTDGLDGLVAADELAGYRHYAEDFRRQSRHALSPAAAEAVAAFDAAADAPTEVIRAAQGADLAPDAVERPDGETVALTTGNVRSELSHPDRAYRRRVYESYREAVDGFEGTITEAFVGKVDAAAAEAELRDYDSVRESALQRRSYPESGLRCALPEAVHDAMLSAVRANLDPYRRALAVRRERLDVEELRPWDREVSVADGDPPTVEYDEAREYVVEALEPLGEAYVDRARSFFEERRIDVFPAAGKRGDIPAYCPSSATDGPYVLANVREDVRTTFFVCHELGHALHVEYHREGPTRYGTCPRPFSEVPSILHELLLAERFLEAGGPLASAARNRLLEFLGGNLYDSAMSAAFVHEMVTAIEAGEAVTPDRAREAWADLQAEFEPVVAFDDRAGRNWLDGWTRELYSNYQYVLGAAGALAVRDRLREAELSPGTYHEVLAATGRRSAVESFEALGCDPTAEAFYERAAAAFDGYVDRIDPD